METQKENSVPREIGSNLTGTAVAGKPGHQRDIPPETYSSDSAPAESAEATEKHIENTDALLGDVHPTRRNEKSQEQHNAERQS